jgi:acetyl-CoA carboxylase beta subunit
MEVSLEDPTRRREDEWFRQNERKLLEEARAARKAREHERQARESEEERQRLKEQHWMRCPKCGHALKSEVLDGIEIDRCTFCEGFFMDAGELEQLFLARGQGQRQNVIRRLLGL